MGSLGPLTPSSLLSPSAGVDGDAVLQAAVKVQNQGHTFFTTTARVGANVVGQLKTATYLRPKNPASANTTNPTTTLTT